MNSYARIKAMRRFRWWLARRIAPAPVMWDAFPGADGVFVYLREAGTVAAYKADKFRLRSRLVLDPRLFDVDLDKTFGDTHRTCITFAGSLVR